MAQLFITLKVMPESPEVDLKKLEGSVKKGIETFGGRVDRVIQEPVAFGLKALMVSFTMDESKGSTDPLEETLQALKDVNSVDVTEVRRMLG